MNLVLKTALAPGPNLDFTQLLLSSLSGPQVQQGGQMQRGTFRYLTRPYCICYLFVTRVRAQFVPHEL